MPLACLALSEPHGSANFMEAGGPGLKTTAALENGEWIVNGEKIWSTSIAGWNKRGPDLICLVCRDSSVDHAEAKSPAESLLILTVPNNLLNADNFVIRSYPRTAGLTATCGPLVILKDLRIPDRPEYVLARGGQAAVSLLEVSKRGSAVAAAMGLGVLRRAIKEAAAFVSSEKRGGKTNRKVVQTEAAVTMLAQLRMRSAVTEALVNSAATKIDGNDPGAREAALQAKVQASEEAIQCVLEASRLVGVTSYDQNKSILSDLLLDAMGLPLIGGSNTMIRKTLATLAA
ncbi:hypothetical protein K461DRAFT_321735 [Myriangium duriaei CBS 260.36]|uniref:Acyl-CoA dehydrogenase/oxidase C-terminal domain-containing protein n=1 Tax=Myriangium duriaei CBS 260.36 TaxID=1168546 RepID=A0A9P4MK51_9PEZI|nr:hypothetical protein K461DRAFT_321735 [Myriangium duriaei CBS 260.36]